MFAPQKKYIRMCQFFKHMRLLDFVGASADVSDEVVFSGDQIGAGLLDSKGIGYLLAVVCGVNSHRGRLRGVTDKKEG